MVDGVEIKSARFLSKMIKVLIPLESTQSKVMKCLGRCFSPLIQKLILDINNRFFLCHKPLAWALTWSLKKLSIPTRFQCPLWKSLVDQVWVKWRRNLVDQYGEFDFDEKIRLESGTISTVHRRRLLVKIWSKSRRFGLLGWNHHMLRKNFGT